ncbi:MAG: hypothetical protein K0U24_06920 [Gammaproteobacteria bacterium]|nr:hypothetical protein [Gammaproteobacteria bacterium]MCH9763935.1 hypothetical protein [Gammaproteobacteria bacterium]
MMKNSTHLILSRLGKSVKQTALKKRVTRAEEVPESPKNTPDMRHTLAACMNNTNSPDDKLGS